MQTLYIDHSVVARESLWESINCAIVSGKIRLALSVWNLVEIGRADDLAQRYRRLSFLKTGAPLWILERRDIQKLEVRNFIWLNKFSAPAIEFDALTGYISVVASFFPETLPCIGLTPEQFIDGINYSELSSYRGISPNSLRIIQDFDQRTIKKKHKELFFAWIGLLIPDRAPNGRAFTKAEKIDILEFCYQKREMLFETCPSLAVEDALMSARTMDHNRRPRESDGEDLQHLVVGLACCDLFYCIDGFMVRCAREAIKSLKERKFATVCASQEEFLEAISVL